MPVYYANFDLADGDNDGSSWANAFRAETEWEAFLEGTIAAGDVVYVMQSSCSADSAWDASARDGTVILPITIIGVKDGTTNAPPVYTDWADGNMAGGADERPTFAMGANIFTVGDNWKLYNLKLTGTGTSVLTTGYTPRTYNCKIVQSSGTNDRNCFNFGNSYGIAVSCEACGEVGVGVVGRGFVVPSATQIIFCYAHDLRYGYVPGGVGTAYMFCTAEDCSVAGFTLASYSGFGLLNCTINDCATGISLSTGVGLIINTIIEDCTTDGINQSTETPHNFYFKNNFHGNADDWDLAGNNPTYPHNDPEETAVDPEFTADHNLSLAATSDCIDAGLALSLGVG